MAAEFSNDGIRYKERISGNVSQTYSKATAGTSSE
jgi:hypothetical protein